MDIVIGVVPYGNDRLVDVFVHCAKQTIELPFRSAGMQLADKIQKAAIQNRYAKLTPAHSRQDAERTIE